MERSVSESSSNDPSAGSLGSVESLNPSATSEITRPAPPKSEPGPEPMRITEPLGAAVPASFQPGLISRTSGEPGSAPPPEGKFFNNPANIRTLITGSGDGYRSPEPPYRLDILPLLHHRHKEREMAHGNSTNYGFHPSGMATERTEPPFSTQQAVVSQPQNGPGSGMDYGYGSLPALSSSLVLPAELMVYNDLMMNISTGQYLGAGIQDLGPPPFTHPPAPMNPGGGFTGLVANDVNQWQGISRGIVAPEPSERNSPFGYPQPFQPHYGLDRNSGQQMGTSFVGQWPTGGTIDYKSVVPHLSNRVSMRRSDAMPGSQRVGASVVRKYHDGSTDEPELSGFFELLKDGFAS